MTYQPKSVGKMADFETLTLCISLNSSQMGSCFSKDLGTVYRPYLVKIRLQPSSVFKMIYYPQAVAMGITSREIRVYTSVFANYMYLKSS